jgi:hypothetical protein
LAVPDSADRVQVGGSQTHQFDGRSACVCVCIGLNQILKRGDTACRETRQAVSPTLR